ncbi:MAG: hypothetical protein KDA41_23050, partial [Planctomycetales bacterium]|nr:hypothetical protein [Planctomycetales bacterium]
VLTWIGVLFTVGFVSLTTGLMYTWFGMTAGSAWLLGLFGMAAMMGSFIVKGTMERLAAARMNECDEDLDRLARQMRKAKQEISEVDALLPPGNGTIALRIQEAERQLEHLETLAPMDADLRQARQSDEAAQDRARHAAARLKDARTAWRDAILRLGLPETVTPAQIDRLTARCEFLLETEERLSHRHGELEKRNAELVSLTGRINRLGDDVGLKSRPRETVEVLRMIVGEHTEQRELIKQRDELRAQAKALRAEYAKEYGELKKTRRQCRSILRSAGCESEDELREATARIARHGELVSRRLQLESEIAAIIGDAPFEEVEAELQSGDKQFLTHRYEGLSLQLGEAEVRLKELYQSRGRLSEQTKALEADRRLPHALLELESVNEEIEQSARRWRTLAATSVILESVRHIYETERQPATLSDASGYLERMTDGRYRRVWTPLAEDTLLVDDAQGNSLRVEVLSAGTREQVFLAIRLALVAMYARRGAALPLVLDDVLV